MFGAGMLETDVVEGGVFEVDVLEVDVLHYLHAINTRQR
jgi:hypothetical protein